MPVDPFETQSPDQPVPKGVGNETNALPQNIGRFRIEKILGQGGFGIVYLGQDEQLQRSAAIKVPKPQFVQRAEDRELYLTEARTVAGLEHPNIVPVLEVGSTPEFPIYIEQLGGECLAGSRITNRRSGVSNRSELAKCMPGSDGGAREQSGLLSRLAWLVGFRGFLVGYREVQK